MPGTVGRNKWSIIEPLIIRMVEICGQIHSISISIVFQKFFGDGGDSKESFTMDMVGGALHDTISSCAYSLPAEEL